MFSDQWSVVSGEWKARKRENGKTGKREKSDGSDLRSLARKSSGV